MEEIVIPEKSPLHEKSLLESGLKKHYGVMVVGIKPVNGKMILNPEPDTVLKEGDTLVLIGQMDQLEVLNQDLKL